MAIRQVITFRVKAGKASAFAASFAPIIAKVRAEDGCEQYDLFVGLGDPDALVMLERWRDLGCLESALKNHYKGPNDPSVAFFQDLVGSPMRERYEF